MLKPAQRHKKLQTKKVCWRRIP